MKSRFIYILLLASMVVASGGASFGAVIEGRVTDFDTGEGVAYATVRVEGTGYSMVANKDGEYRLKLRPGDYQLKFSHIAHYSERVDVSVADTAMVLDVRLHPGLIQLKPLKVYQRAFDPAQRIIVAAIDRKDEILSQIHDYTFEAYTKLVIRDTSKARDSTDIMVITESQVTYFWEQPDKYKEIIRGRRQTANLQPEQNLASVGGVLNLNLNRINIGRHSVVSPTARDALKHYNFYLLDTIYIDNRAVFRLEVEPRSQSEPLFAGIIDIADSSYMVVGVDIVFNEALDLPFLDSLRFRQSFAEFERGFWMPIEQRINGIVNLQFPGIPVFSIDYISAMHDYSFDVGHPPGTFDEYAVEVADEADDIDSSAWLASQLIPLTEQELDAYQRIDSVTSTPKTIPQRLMQLGMTTMYLTVSAYDLFHFNRVEGAYVGVGFDQIRILPRLQAHFKTGWAFDGKYWRHNYGVDYALSLKRRFIISAEYHDEIAARPTVISDMDYNPTLFALITGFDHFDYYHEKGFLFQMESKLLAHTRLTIGYRDYNQYSASNHTGFTLFDRDKGHRANPAIAEGKLRSVSADFVWDSRKLMKSKSEEFPITSLPYTIFKSGVEYASPGFIDNDFDYTRYCASIFHRRRALGLGVSSLFACADLSERNLPPQKYFTVDFGREVMAEALSFKTLGENNFWGNRAAAVYLSHNFGRILFRKTGLPLIKDVPFSLSVYGGAFWTEFRNHTTQPGDKYAHIAEKPYGEIGFGIGRLPLLSLKLMFTWQLSDYDTSDFAFDFNFEF